MPRRQSLTELPLAMWLEGTSAGGYTHVHLQLLLSNSWQQLALVYSSRVKFWWARFQRVKGLSVEDAKI